MTRHATAPVKAFTVGFPGTSIDETEAPRGSPVISASSISSSRSSP